MPRTILGCISEQSWSESLNGELYKHKDTKWSNKE